VPAYVAGAVALIATILTYFFLPESIHPKAENTPEPVKKKISFFSIRDFYDALTHPDVGLFLTISFMIMFGFSLMQGTFTLYTEHTLHWTAKDNGLVFAYLGVIGVLMQLFFLKKILAKVSERRATVISIIAMGIALGMVGLTTNIPLLMVAVTFIALGNSISGPVLAGLISKKTPDNEQGNIAGMNQSVGSVARLVGPLFGTFLYSQLGTRSPYLIAMVILLMTAFLSIRKLTAEKEK
jgi:predicted MFS family arabinose efflux permease